MVPLIACLAIIAEGLVLIAAAYVARLTYEVFRGINVEEADERTPLIATAVWDTFKKKVLSKTKNKKQKKNWFF